MRQPQRGRLGPTFLALLLLVPLFTSGHFHASHAVAPCAACAVTQHTPVVGTPAIAMVTSVALIVAVDAVAVAVPVGPAVRQPTTRGPPAIHLSQGV